MDDGTHTAPTIRSASDEAAPKTEMSKGRSIRSASEEHAPKADAVATQGARGVGQQQRPWPPKLPGAGNGQSVPDVGRSAEQSLNRATELGSALTSGYGTAFSEAVTFMNRAVERQNEMMGSMLRAQGPLDIVQAGNRYLLGGWLAFFEVNVRVAQAASRLTDDVKQSPDRFGA